MRRLIWSMAIAGSALAQRPAFEVASVKPSPAAPFGQNLNINLGAVQHNELTLTNTTLCESLRFAYHLLSDDQVAGPRLDQGARVPLRRGSQGPSQCNPRAVTRNAADAAGRAIQTGYAPRAAGTGTLRTGGRQGRAEDPSVQAGSAGGPEVLARAFLIAMDADVSFHDAIVAPTPPGSDRQDRID